ncbi:MAG: transposase [Gemmatimonadetes bacterium]|jgi:transposase|nr:transposase [Gemmatimonadota bacterium]MBT4513402.1 transposase [Chloroflexota bacterium]MBT7914828.1 transposase [Candidatus Bathyarchaeota archaeon]
MSAKRKQYTPQQKVSILRRHFIDGVAVSDLCDEYGIHPTVFYRWQKAFFENGAAAFQTQQSQQEKQWKKQITTLESRLSQKNEVLAEVMEEHVRLKKSLGEI